MSARDVSAYVPMSEAMFHVLVSIADQARHGYSIMQEVAGRTGGALELSTGTLYGIIKRLLAHGLIAEVRRPARGEGDRRRRLYALTPFGREVAQAEAARLHKLVAAARSASLIPGRST
jgi:DNA-binding PadR family transcriptional regulator